MAKAKVKGLDEELNRVFSRYKSNLKKAMQEAADKAELDIRLEAESCLQQYYNNFWPDTHKPKQYRRTESLHDAFVPYNEIIEDKQNNAWVVNVGMSYDSSRLVGAYHSEASQKTFERPLHVWVLENYLGGIHPYTNGYPLVGDTLEYFEMKDEISPEEHMKAFLEEYYKTFYENVVIALAKRVNRER